jgi:hypothetical protein
MGADQYVTGMRLALAQFEARHGGFAGARPVFEEIWASGPREGSGLVRLQAGLALARERLIGPDDVEDAGLATRRELGHRDRMRFELELWELTGRREHLLIAADLLGQILRGAPAESRGTILTRAQVNRELVQALRDAGEPIPTQIG